MQANPVFFESTNFRFDPSHIKKKLDQNHLLAKRLDRALFVTKVLRLQKIRKGEEAEKLVPSSNLFDQFDLTPGKEVVEEVIGYAKGMIVRLATALDTNTKKIYSRRYKNKEKVETMMDIRHQGKIKESFAGAKRVHLLIEHGKVTITPIFEGEVEPKHLEINFDTTNADALHLAAAKTLHVINNHKFSEVTANILEGTNTKLVELLDIQLRRQGYTTKVTESSIKAELSVNTTGVSKTSLDNYEGYQRLTPNIDTNNDLSTFVACTGGVDAHLLELDNYTVNNIMDFCPTEARDWKATKKVDSFDGSFVRVLNDKTELCLINALVNTFRAEKVALFNEDIFLSDIKRVGALSQPFNFLHFSPCCQDFSSLKSEEERQRASANLTASRDMFVKALELIHNTKVPCVLFENVVPFGKRIEAHILIAGLTAMGYTIHKKIMKASEYNCFTNRDRFYLFATLLPETFSFPEPIARTVNAWDVIKPHLMGPFKQERGYMKSEYLRDVSHTKAIQNGKDKKRSRFMTLDKNISPSIPRAQSRQVKDALYIEHEGMYLYPRIALQRDLMSIPASFDLSLVSEEVATEIVGNSIESPQHSAILGKIKEHIVSGLKSLMPPVKKEATAGVLKQLFLAIESTSPIRIKPSTKRVKRKARSIDTSLGQGCLVF